MVCTIFSHEFLEFECICGNATTYSLRGSNALLEEFVGLVGGLTGFSEELSRKSQREHGKRIQQEGGLISKCHSSCAQGPFVTHLVRVDLEGSREHGLNTI